MKLIAVVSQDWGIGYQGRLLFSLPGDLRRFRALTLGQTILMGRATLDSLPGGQPLPGRRNLVLTHDRSFFREQAIPLYSVSETLDYCTNLSGKVWVIGGASVYQVFLPFCEAAELTFVRASRPADRFLPKLDEASGWKLAGESETFREGNTCYTFRTYQNMRQNVH